MDNWQDKLTKEERNRAQFLEQELAHCCICSACQSKFPETRGMLYGLDFARTVSSCRETLGNEPSSR